METNVITRNVFHADDLFKIESEGKQLQKCFINKKKRQKIYLTFDLNRLLNGR